MKVLNYIIVFASLTLGAFPLPAENIDLNAINDFSQRLFEKITDQLDTNFIVSGVSVWNLFVVLSEGASGETYDEIKHQLNLPDSTDLTRNLYSELDRVLTANYTQVTLQRTGAMYIDKFMSLHKDYGVLASSVYKTSVKEVDRTNLTKLAQDINYDVCIATNGAITKAVNKELIRHFRLVLVDAIFFKGHWTESFEAEKTREEVFYDHRGRKLGTVNMMYQKARNALVYVDEINAQALQLTYGPDRRFSMVILLPYEGAPLKSVLNSLISYTLRNVLDDLNKTNDYEEIDCFVPRFKISSAHSLKNTLKYMGVHDIFAPDRAHLLGISKRLLYVSSVLQKAEIDVTEEGTIVAAASIVGLEDRILESRVEVNRPFMFFIIERESTLLLFSGIYTSPSLE